MREIKFRAWDEVNHYMLPDYDNWIDFDGGYFTTPEKGFDTPFTEIVRKEGVILMQYTGLKDKNGKEVYDKDIVRCSSGCLHVIEWRDEIGGKYGGGMPGWYLSGLLSGYGEGYAWTGREEIIGNMYQNPELFKETK